MQNELEVLKDKLEYFTAILGGNILAVHDELKNRVTKEPEGPEKEIHLQRGTAILSTLKTLYEEFNQQFKDHLENPYLADE